MKKIFILLIITFSGHHLITAQLPPQFHIEVLNDLFGRSSTPTDDRIEVKLMTATNVSFFIIGNSYFFDLRDIAYMGIIKSGRFSEIGLYTKDNKPLITSKFMEKTFHVSYFHFIYIPEAKARQVLSRLKKLFESLHIAIPSEDSEWLKNDRDYYKIFALKPLSGEEFATNSIHGIDSNINGKHILKYPNGKIRSIRNFKNGIFNGKQYDYFDNGQIASESSYINGFKDGLMLIYSSEGILYYKYAYKNGKKDGLHETWGFNGKKASEQYYENDVMKTQKMWDEKGNLTVDDKF